jgi:hypothetical protein
LGQAQQVTGLARHTVAKGEGLKFRSHTGQMPEMTGKVKDPPIKYVAAP